MFYIFGIFIATALLSFMVYRGNTVIFSAPITVVVLIMLGGVGLSYANVIQYFQVLFFSLSKYLVMYFPVFSLGAVFGIFMKNSEYGKTIAYWLVEKIGQDQAVLCTVLLCAILTYSGLSLFVIAFVIYPIIKPLFQCANVPKRLIPATIAFGSFTFTMGAFPGSDSVVNMIPSSFFHTDIYAAPMLGVICGLIMLLMGVFWIQKQVKKANLIGEGFAEGYVFPEDELSKVDVSFTIAILPVIIILSMGFFLPKYVEVAPDFSFLKKRQYTNSDVKVFFDNLRTGCSLLVAIMTIIFSKYRNFSEIMKNFNKGAERALPPIINTASVIGYGSVVAIVPAFETLKGVLINLAGGNPIISSSLSTMVLSACCGSASTGIGLSLRVLGDFHYKLTSSLNMDLEILHRITAMSCGIFDSLPGNGAIVTIMIITGLSFKEAYKDIFVTTVLIPLITVIGAIAFSAII